MGIGGDSFRKILGSKTSETNLLEFNGKRLGVDVGCLLHQLAAFHAPDLVMKDDPTKLVEHTLSILSKFVAAGAKVLCVCDSPANPPPI
jgi:hypothetical protein